MFRKLEGIGILSLVLETNGFSQFKIKQAAKDSNNWTIDMTEEERAKPSFVLYTGTESKKEKEIIRNIFNSNWNSVPDSLKIELEKLAEFKSSLAGDIPCKNYKGDIVPCKNLNGEIIKILMITASGAEGISLSNVRFVHITEPFWHPVRVEQVIGRARRICSHKELPIELQTVKVFLYLMTFTDAQVKDIKNYKELITNDKGKRGENLTRPITSDEVLFEISTIKEEINKGIIKHIKEAAIDCSVHTTFKGKEKLACFSFNSEDKEQFSYIPDFKAEDNDATTDMNQSKIKLKGTKFPLPEGGIGVFVRSNGNVYTLDSFQLEQPIQIGRGEIIDGQLKYFPIKTP